MLKTQRWVLIFIFIVEILAYSSVGWAQQQLPTVSLSCKYIGPIEAYFIKRHITFEKLSPLLETRFIEQYVKRLDPAKINLLEGDVTSIKKKLSGVFSQVADGNCSEFTEIRSTLKKRMEERVEFAKKYLEDKKFKFDKKTELVLDPDHRKYPKTAKEADHFQSKYIQFQIAGFLATDTKLEEARGQLVRRYERAVRRFKSETEDEIYAGVLDAFARSMDPHSQYLSNDQLEEFRISMGLSLEGIGATLSSQDGFTTIEQLIPGGAAARTGSLIPKDKIMYVGQGESGSMENVMDWDLRDVVKKIRGKKDTKVRLGILRNTPKGKKSFVVTLIRDKIKLDDEAAIVLYQERKTDVGVKKIALVHLPSFYADTNPNGRRSARDLKRLLLEVKAKKVDAMVLDLSSNPGGSLDDAIKIAGMFFKTGAVVKQAIRGAPSEPQALIDDDPDVDYSGPLVVLTSRASASASEIVSGALKDYRRAVVVGGDHSFGKGSIQTVIPIPILGLGAAKITVGMFFIPSGESTQHRGVDADIVFPSFFSNEDIGEKTLDYSLAPQKIKPFLSKEAYVSKGEGAWKPVDTDAVKTLRLKSKNRIAHNEKFDKLVKERIKQEKAGRKVIVGDLLANKAEDGQQEDSLSKNTKSTKDNPGKDSDKVSGAKDYLTRDERNKNLLERADVEEALNIAADLSDLINPIRLTQNSGGKLGTADKTGGGEMSSVPTAGDGR